MLTVPELPEEIRALKDRARQFVETEVYPVEQQIANGSATNRSHDGDDQDPEYVKLLSPGSEGATDSKHGHSGQAQHVHDVHRGKPTQ